MNYYIFFLILQYTINDFDRRLAVKQNYKLNFKFYLSICILEVIYFENYIIFDFYMQLIINNLKNI